MTATPTTTKLGPDQSRLKALMRRLAEATSTEAPILSLYIDVRPEAHDDRPGERNELIVVRDRLNAIADTLDPHTDARVSFDANRARIEELLEGEDLNATDGVAVFACNRIGLWEAIGSTVDFDTQIAAGPTGELFQLARMLDESVSAVVAVVDTNTCRLFLTRRGGLEERRGLDEPTEEHERHDVGGWSQARYQRHIDMQDKRFAKEAAVVIERLVQREKPQHAILAGDERAISVLDGELSEVVRPLVDYVARLGMRSSTDEVPAEVAPILALDRQSLPPARRVVAPARRHLRLVPAHELRACTDRASRASNSLPRIEPSALPGDELVARRTGRIRERGALSHHPQQRPDRRYRLCWRGRSWVA